MDSLLKLYSNKKSQLAGLIKMAQADGIIKPPEFMFLEIIAFQLG